MTKNLVSNKRRIAGIAAVSALGAILGWAGFSTGAQVQTSAPATAQEVSVAGATTDLERNFWLCDYAGTVTGVDSGTALACSAITEELKNRKFNGDFEGFVAWWRENKQAEHRAIQTAIP